MSNEFKYGCMVMNETCREIVYQTYLKVHVFRCSEG